MNKAKILVVEDEALLAEDIAESLREMGFDVPATASSGEKAIELAEALKPDLILMDIQLNGEIDGIEAATRINKNNKCAIVFQTAYAEDPMLERATEAEPYGYLVKPIGERELKATVRMALYKAEMEAEREATNKKLQKALDEIKTLQEIIPICAWCKKLRDDDGYWSNVEDYLAEHTNSVLTHGICPSCQQKMIDNMKTEENED